MNHSGYIASGGVLKGIKKTIFQLKSWIDNERIFAALIFAFAERDDI